MKTVMSLELLGSPIWGWLVLLVFMVALFAMNTDVGTGGCHGNRESCAEEYYDQTHYGR